MTTKLTINLNGALAVVDRDGILRTPRGQKTCAVVALLATAPRIMRARRWIEAKLWSDRGQEQANASLRQALSELRKSFGPAADVLCADRKNVWLDPGAVEVVLPDGRTLADEEFLCGIDIKDDAFEDWLRQTRNSFQQDPVVAAYNPTPSVPAKIRLIAAMPNDTSQSAFCAEVATHEVIKYIAERTVAMLSEPGEPNLVDPSETTVEVGCEMETNDGGSQVFLRARNARTGWIICSRFETFDVPATSLLQDDKFRGFIADVSEQIIFKLPSLPASQHGNLDALGRVHDAVADVFSYDIDRLNAAEGNLLRAYQRTGNSSILVWLAWQKTTQVIEETVQDKEDATEFARYYCAQALEKDPHSAFANAMSSLVHMIHFDEIETSFQLAERASSLSKFDPYVQAALATAYMFAGRPRQAAEHSLVGTKLSRFTGNVHWWDLSHSLTSLSCGDFDAAEQYAVRAAKAAPKFRAPKRILLALYAHRDRAELANEQMRKLRLVERDFSLDRFVNDPEYPNTTIRKAGLLKELGGFDFD